MSILSAQTIRKLCLEPTNTPTRGRLLYADDNKSYVYHGKVKIPYHGPLITPFTERGVIRGRSYGLSACTYDCRTRNDVFLQPGGNALTSTIEMFSIPFDICGSVLDKSTWARVFVSAFNTHLDPGWRPIKPKDTNHLTVELVNMSNEPINILAGDPICQIKFEWLDEPTDIPYQGKYNSQPDHPVPAIFEIQN
jgi:dCTP deaminase